jgi:hypothetical protein
MNILRKNCAPIWLYLKDYTGMHGQKGIKLELLSLPISPVIEFLYIRMVFEVRSVLQNFLKEK